MEIQPQPFTPQHPLLQKHISFFYFLSTSSESFETKYYAFPSVDAVVNIHRNANCEIEKYFTKVYGSPYPNYLTLAQGCRELPLRVHLQGKLDKVTIIFKPLGLNHFIKQTLSQELPSDSQVFTAWQADPGYATFLDAFYDTSDTTQRAELLENFLLSHYQPFAQQDVLAEALALLTDFDRNLSIEEIARHLGFNSRTFFRLFKKHLGISPASYRKIARFRHSLQNKLIDTQFKKLTEIGYESNFSDQAYFTKIYKELTGANPRKFFRSIDKLADNRLVFQFIKSGSV